MKTVKILGLVLPMAFCAFAAMPVSAAEQPAEAAVWIAKIGDAVRNPNVVKEVMSQLKTREGKTAFVAALNKAIAALPDGRDRKAAYSLAVNTAAVEAAGRSDRLAVLAEVFATASCESLTVINEEFATKLFSRDAASQMTDTEYKALATKVLGIVAERCSSAETPAVRETFAALMFLNATPSSSAEFREELAQALVETLPADKRETAKKSWIAAALGMDQSKSYGPILGEVDGAEPVDRDAVTAASTDIANGHFTTESLAANGEQSVGSRVVLQETTTQLTDSMLADLTADHTYETEPALNTVGVVGQTSATVPGATAAMAAQSATPGAAMGGTGTATVPRDWISNPTLPDGSTNPNYSPSADDPSPQKDSPREPIWYNGQIIGYK